MKLYYSTNPNPRLAVAVARYLNAPVAFVAPDRNDTALMADINRWNPNGLFPVLVEDDGAVLWETDAIACRLSWLMQSEFWLTGAAQASMIRWISWAHNHFNKAVDTVHWERVTKQRYNMGPVDQANLTAGLAGFAQTAPILDAALSNTDYICGDSVCYADFRLATFLYNAAPAGLPLQDYPHIDAWNDRLNQISAWGQAFEGIDES
jgi:glutathione S-transferase